MVGSSTASRFAVAVVVVDRRRRLLHRDRGVFVLFQRQQHRG
jgi:hypothetical protein